MNNQTTQTKTEEKATILNQDGKQLSKAEVQPRKEIAPTTQASGVSELIAMAINADLDIEKLERLMEMKEREEVKTAYAAFVVAISQFQADCPTVKKTGTVTDKHGKRLYTFPKFDCIMTTIQPHMEKNGLSVRFSSDISDGQVKICCMVSHAAGHTDESFFSCPIEVTMTGGANASQRTASANSFAKRYAIMNALNIAGSDYDDDGQSLDKETELIDDKDAIMLREMIEALPGAQDGDEAILCGFLSKGISSFDDLPIELLGKARKSINEQKNIDEKTE